MNYWNHSLAWSSFTYLRVCSIICHLFSCILHFFHSGSYSGISSASAGWVSSLSFRSVWRIHRVNYCADTGSTQGPRQGGSLEYILLSWLLFGHWKHTRTPSRRFTRVYFICQQFRLTVWPTDSLFISTGPILCKNRCVVFLHISSFSSIPESDLML